VEYHLRNSYIRLDITSRRELAALLTMTGSTKAAASSRMVAMVTDCSIRRACGPAGRGAVPAVTVIA
jgi:hypothetical protein